MLRANVAWLQAIIAVTCCTTVAGSEECHLSRSDLVANAKLSFDEFDQKGVLASTWRALSKRKCPLTASEAMEDFLIHGSVTDPKQRADMAFHLGQTLAAAGSNVEASIAIANAKLGSGINADGLDWNTYVTGTWAFLKRDKTELSAEHDRLVGESGSGNKLNAAALGGLLNCFDLPYAVAYEKACRSQKP